MKKTVLFLLVTLLLAACTMAAPQPEATQEPAVAQDAQPTPSTSASFAPRPTIQMVIGDETIAGVPAAYCWLEATNDIVCQPDPDDLTTGETTTIAAGDSLTFTVQGGAGAPAAFYANLLDEDTGGEPTRIDFGAVNSAQYAADLTPGVHHLAVIAEYPLASGDTPFVSVVFAVEVPQEMAAIPTIEASATHAPATARPTATRELKPTEASAALSSPLPEATTAAPTKAPTEGVTETPTETPPTQPPSPTPPPQPTLRPTEPQPTALPTTAPTEGPGSAEDVPEVIAVNGGQNYVPSAVRFCPQGTTEDACIDLPATAESERILVANGDTIRVDLASPGPSSLSLALANNSLTQEINRTELAGSTIALYTVSGDPGNYILVVSAQWPEGLATYYFRLQIQG